MVASRCMQLPTIGRICTSKLRVTNNTSPADTALGSVQEDTQVDLDRKRNALFALQLLITIVTMGLSLVSMVSGLFGMNLWDHMGQQSHFWFTFVCGASMGISAVLVFSLILFLRSQRMLFVGE